MLAVGPVRPVLCYSPKLKTEGTGRLQPVSVVKTLVKLQHLLLLSIELL